MEELRANVHDDQGNSAFSMKSKQKHTAKGPHGERKPASYQENATIVESQDIGSETVDPNL